MHIPLSFLENLALKAGEIIRKGFSQVSKVKSEWKEDETPVTAADIAVNELVLNAFKEQYPDVCFIGEEGSNIVEGADWVVYCDPIDGTFPYATGMAISTFCISVLYKGQPTLAVIYDPFTDRMYKAEKGKGAFMNDIRLKVSEQKKVETKTHIHLIWWKGSRSLNLLCAKLVEKGAAWMNFGTIGIVGGLIAAGQFEASVFPGNKVWETAAMSLIVEEAGGKCTDLEGNPINYLENGNMKGHIVSNGWVHEELLAMV
jgi:fructose-1,6-bisphosphatase/inositol monophosphatase family enzyme